MTMYDHDSQANLHCPRTERETQTPRPKCWTQRIRPDTERYRSNTRRNRPNQASADGTRLNHAQRKNSDTKRCRKSLPSILTTNRRPSPWTDPSGTRGTSTKVLNDLLRHISPGQTLRHKGNWCESSDRIICHNPEHFHEFAHTTRSDLSLENQRTQFGVYSKRRVPHDDNTRFAHQRPIRPYTTTTKHLPTSQTIATDLQTPCIRCDSHCHSPHHRSSCQRPSPTTRVLDKRQRPGSSGSSNGFNRHNGVITIWTDAILPTCQQRTRRVGKHSCNKGVSVRQILEQHFEYATPPVRCVLGSRRLNSS
jgi:hypothetical protein